MNDSSDRPGWKGPTIRKVAELAGVGPATVDRVLNNRTKVRENTRNRVLAALAKLSSDGRSETRLRLRLFCDSGDTFNFAMRAAMDEINGTMPGIEIEGHFVPTSDLDPMPFARSIEQDSAGADGVLVIAREHPAVNRVIRKLCVAGIPVVCVTTDLPSSRRSAYIGNDQYAAGSVAGLLIGRAMPRTPAHILIVASEPFRCQQEREMGCRRVLRSDFPHLRIDERVISDDRPESTRIQLVRHFQANGGPPAAIYNVAGANRGIAQALQDCNQGTKTFFVGHELSPHSRSLLEAGVMDYVISHDFLGELNAAIRWIQSFHEGVESSPGFSQILVHTRYNCGP